MNGSQWQNPRFARNENVQLVASFNRSNRVEQARRFERNEPINREFDREMRTNTARFI